MGYLPGMIARFNFALSVIIFLLGLVSLLLSFTVWYRYHVQIPAGDTLELLHVARSAMESGWSSISLDEWLELYSGAHRVAVTRVLMVFDYAYLGGRNAAIYLSAWLSIAVLLLAYTRAAWSSLSAMKEARFFLGGLALLFICSPTQYWNLVNPINASWYVVFAASAASVWVLISCGKELSAKMALLACCLSTVGVLSNFAGLLGCLMLPVIVLYHRSSNSVWVVLFSVVCVLLYLQGVESGYARLVNSEAFQLAVQAEIAADPELAQKTTFFYLWLKRLSDVVVNTGLQLGAPLSVKHAALASGIVFISVVFIAYSWFRVGVNWYKENDPIPKAVEFYLIMATICLGVSAAIWFGRAIFVFPASDRYQTITMLYWLSMSCLLLCQFYPASNSKRALLLLLSVALIPLIMLAGTKAYSLPHLAGVSDSAARTQILGGMGLARLKGDNAVLAMDKKDYFSQYFEFLSSYGFTAIEEKAFIAEQDMPDANLCPSLEVTTKSTQWPDIQRVFLSFDRNIAIFLRRVDLIGAQGEQGRLYLIAPKQYLWRNIILDSRKWDGFYQGNMEASMPVELLINPVFGRSYRCRISVESFDR